MKGLIEVQQQPARDALALVENAVSVMISDFQRRGIGREAPGAASVATLGLIDQIEHSLKLAQVDLAKLSVCRARVASYMSAVERDEVKKSEHVAASISELSRAVSIVEDEPRILLQVASTLESLPQPQTVTFEGDLERDWHDIYEMITDRAEAEGDFRSADHARQRYLRKLLNVRHASPKFYSLNRYSTIETYVRRTSLLTNSVYDNDRLNLLLDLAGWAAQEYRDGQQVPIGLPEDEFPSSRRSVYKAIWKELHRLQVIGRIKRVLRSKLLLRQLDKTRRLWAADEKVAPKKTVWPTLRARGASVQDLINTADWEALAAAFPTYYPNDPLCRRQLDLQTRERTK
ncbi:hypothetical protein AAE026_24125 [Bradyrhizobium sp. DN5]|uniref:hypothetical protein n=1 Tax=Bradyrhizobium sp. DN5 TaxID=3056950 RepID=UPI003524010A